MSNINEYYSTIRSPFGDILGLFGNCQIDKRCRELELNVLDCTDVYGHKGLKKQCKDEFEDFMECLHNKKQMARVEAMRNERMRQYVAGERSKKDFYAKTPKLDSYFQTYGQSID